MTQKTTGRGQWTYVYDTDNRLIAVGYAPNGKAYKTIGNYAYDAKGARYQKIVYRYADTDYNNSDTWSLLVEQIGSPTIPAGGSITSTTTYAGSYYEAEDGRFTKRVFLGGTLVASMTVGQVSYFHNDHLGSVNVISDSTGAKRSLTEYDPFGKVSRFERSTPKVQTGWEGFNGKRLDDETGLLFYGGRYYDPKLGRFMTADKIVPYASDPQSLNRYSYVRNNPVNLVDPSGHKFKWGNIFRAVAIVAVGAILTVATGGAMAALGFAANSFWTGVAVGAVMGGTIGGATSAAVGGNIGQGILTGAISGAVFGGIGSWAHANQIGTTMRAFAHGIGGAVTGGINSAITGGDVWRGALVSGVSAGLGVKFGGSNLISRSAFGAVMGGAVAAATGGDFWAGAQQGATTAAVAYMANDMGQYIAGKVGEIAAGITKNTQKIASALRVGAQRIPDELNEAERLIGEVKNVAYQSLTNQLKDYYAIAQREGYKLRIYLNETAEMSAPFRAWVAETGTELMLYAAEAGL